MNNENAKYTIQSHKFRGLLDQICLIFLYKLIKLKEQQIKLNKKILIRFSSIFSKYLRKKKERVNKL